MFNLVPKYIFIFKLIRKISDEKNKLFKFLPFYLLVNFSKKKCLIISDSKRLKNRLKQVLGNFDDFVKLEIKETDHSKIITDANNALEHKFDVLGSGLTKVEPIDWHTDFKSGFKWGKGRFYKNYQIVNNKNNADIKVCWDLSRCHHLLWLGQAYLLTKDEKYSKEVVFQIEDWIKENPLMLSVNWTCAMDVSIRSVNWLYVLNMISSSIYFSDDFTTKVSKSLFEHGFFIYNNLEKSTPYSSNHYVANLTGLIFIGTLFNTSKQGMKWRVFGLKEYFNEVRTQILPSGVHYERSVSYHRLVTELFLYPYLMLLRTKEKVPNEVEVRLKNMLLFIQNYIKPNGKSPLIGDNDNGRLLPFVNYDFNDHNYLVELASKFYSDSKSATINNVDTYFGLNGVDCKQNESFTNTFIKPIVYLDAGFAIFKKKDLYIFFKNGEYSKYAEETTKIIGTHTHADSLSFELCIGNDDFIVDPGSYCYTSSAELRNEFRSTKKHNTIHVDNLDQLELVDSNIFAVKGYRYPEKIHHVMVDNTEVLSGVFKWKIPEQKSITHRRNIIVENVNKFHVLDEIDNSNSHNFTLSYHFSDQVKTTLIENSVVLETKSGAVLTIDFEISIDFKITIINDTISSSYGIIQKSKTMRLECNSNKSFSIKSNFTYKSKN